MTQAEADELLRQAEALEAEAIRLWTRLLNGTAGRAAAAPGRSTPVGRNALFSAVETTRMPMILTDPNQPDNPIIFANRAFQELSGYGSDELLGRNCRFLQGPGTGQPEIARIRDALADERDVAVEILNYRRDGTPFINELFISPVFDRDGRLLYYFGSQLDVTAHHQARRALEESERRQRAILGSAVDIAIIATDRDGRVTDWNTGAERILGWSAQEMRGQTTECIFTPEDRAIDRRSTEMRLSLWDGRASDNRWHLRRDGERFWASGEVMPLRAADGAHLGFIKVMRDLTAEHHAGKALRQAEADLN